MGTGQCSDSRYSDSHCSNNGQTEMQERIRVQNVTSRGLERGIAALVPISRYDNNKRGWRNRIRSSGTNPVKTTVRETDIVANNVTCFY